MYLVTTSAGCTTFGITQMPSALAVLVQPGISGHFQDACLHHYIVFILKTEGWEILSFSASLQPWNSDSSLGSRQLESRSETDGSNTPQSNAGMRLHEFVSKTVGGQAVETWAAFPFHFFGVGDSSQSWTRFIDPTAVHSSERRLMHRVSYPIPCWQFQLWAVTLSPPLCPGICADIYLYFLLSKTSYTAMLTVQPLIARV